MVQKIMEEKIGPYSCRIISTVDFVKEVAKFCGWDGQKRPQDREFLSDLKDILTQWNDIPYKDITSSYERDKEIWKQLGYNEEDCLYFIMCREPKEIQKLLTKVEDTPEEAMISRLALRSMKQAKYTVENDGHFGLAANYYTHFTSPIRRYPDLQIHRIIKDNLRGRMNADKMEHYRSILPEVAKRSSEMERRADEAERETVKLKKVEYMQAHIGEEFEGVISGITKWGMYVELPNTIEGLVHVTNMTDDHYEYNEERYEMMGMHTRKVYKLGEGLRVRVLDADRLMRTIDFKIVNQGGAGDGEE